MKMRGGTPGSNTYPTTADELEGKSSETTDPRKSTSDNRTLSLNRCKAPPASDDVDIQDRQHRDKSTNSMRASRAKARTSTSQSSVKVQRGNIYYFSRNNIADGDQKQSSQHQSSQHPRATTGSHSEFDVDQEREAEIDCDFSDAPAQSSSSGADSVSGLSHPPAPENAPAKPQSEWMDHPISRALTPYNEVDSPLNPARIVAESLQPFIARSNQPVETDPAPQADIPEDVPIRPVPSERTEETAEIEAVAIDAGDKFWDLWIGHQDQMRGQCIRLMAGNVADAEDALSSAMLRASKKFPSYSESIVNGKAWLRKLVYNVCMDHYRQGKYTEYRAFDQDTDIPAAGAMFTGEQQSPEDIALSQEQIRELDACLDALSGNLRVPLLLRCVEGWSYPDIAKQLNLRADTVRKRIQLARDHLRRSNIR